MKIGDLVQYILRKNNLKVYGIITAENYKGNAFFIRKSNGNVIKKDKTCLKAVKFPSLVITQKECDDILKGVIVLKHKLSKSWERVFDEESEIVKLLTKTGQKMIVEIRQFEKIIHYEKSEKTWNGYFHKACKLQAPFKEVLYIRYSIKNIIYYENSKTRTTMHNK